MHTSSSTHSRPLEYCEKDWGCPTISDPYITEKSHTTLCPTKALRDALRETWSRKDDEKLLPADVAYSKWLRDTSSSSDLETIRKLKSCWVQL